MVGASEALLKDLSVHVCFICVLHLANEHALRITGVPGLDSMAIHSG
jgi:condensin complex subunit 2